MTIPLCVRTLLDMKDAREERGLAIAQVARIDRKDDGTWLVPSMSGNGRYTVNVNSAKPTCTCPDCEKGFKCKHIYAVEFYAKRETRYNTDGSVTVTETVAIRATQKKTYKQDWPAYNAAQTTEKHHFQELLYDLCGGLEELPPSKGRPFMPLRDAVFCIAFKIFSTVSARRFIADLDDARRKGFIQNVPHFNTIYNYLENPALTDVLTNLIVQSSLPLRSVDVDFAVDSTGFTSSRFMRWYDVKYGTVQVQHDWVKLHFACGVKTNVVTAVKIEGRDANDSPLLPELASKTAENFNVREVSADKGYSSRENHDAITAIGAVPFIAFKANATGAAGGTFEKAFHYFNFKRQDFLNHYHKRSNVESTVSMMKAKFRDHVRSKTDIAMKNEVLCKVLCHNICCLISAIYELDLEPVFWQDQPETTCTTRGSYAQ